MYLKYMKQNILFMPGYSFKLGAITTRLLGYAVNKKMCIWFPYYVVYSYNIISAIR